MKLPGIIPSMTMAFQPDGTVELKLVWAPVDGLIAE
jgi:hypothetical protein